MQFDLIFSHDGSEFDVNIDVSDSFDTEFDGASSLREYADYAGSYNVVPAAA